jgi:predicted nuclease of predicted toxin-antitoxin system
MIKFIVDTQLPPKLSKHLLSEGYDSIHTTDFPEGHFLKDHEIIEIATNEDRIIITKDQDFFDYYLLKGAPPKVLLL